jgi:hypothetical protein
LAGTTEFVVAAVAPGVVEFDYLYSCTDFPGWDSAGYLVGGTYVQLADAGGQSELDFTFPVSAGETFGWRIVTEDNTGEPGTLTIMNFSAPLPEPAGVVPEPGGLMLMCIGVAFVALGQVRGLIKRWWEDKR